MLLILGTSLQEGPIVPGPASPHAVETATTAPVVFGTLSLKATTRQGAPILPAPASPHAVEAISIAPVGCRQRSAQATTRSMQTSSLAIALIARLLHLVLCVKATVIPMRIAWAILSAFSAATGKQSQDVEAQSLEVPLMFNTLIFAMIL